MNAPTLSLIFFVLVAALLWLMPRLVFPTVPFGVRIPLSRRQDPRVRVEHTRYAWRIGVLAVALLSVAIGSTIVGWSTGLPVALLGLVVGGWGLYYLSHRSLSEIKTRERWFAEGRPALVASAQPRWSWPDRPAWILLGVSCGVIVATAGVGIWRYPALSGELRYAWPLSLGTWTVRADVLGVFLPVLLQLVATALLVAFAWMRQSGAQPIDVEDPEGSQRWQRLNLQIVQGLILSLAGGLNGAFLVAAFKGWGLSFGDEETARALILAPLIGWLILAPVLLLALRGDARQTSGSPDFRNRDDDAAWKLGSFYFNRNDPALMVNKRFGIGRTLNFGHPLAWVVVAGLLLLIVFRILSRP